METVLYDDGCGLVYLLLFAVLCGVIGYLILNPFQKGQQGCLLGGMLGPLGVIITLVQRANYRREETLGLPPDHVGAVHRDERECPHCAEQILSKAKVCKHCGRDVEPIPEPPAGDRPDNSPLSWRAQQGPKKKNPWFD